MNEISRTTGIEKVAVQTTVEAFMEAIKGSVIDGKSGKKRKRHKMATHKRKKRLRKSRHKKK